MRSTFAIAVAAAVVAPAFVSALPTPHDGSLYVRKASDSKYTSSAIHPAAQLASGVMSHKEDDHHRERDHNHGHDHKHKHHHMHGHDHKSLHGPEHNHKFASGQEHVPQRATGAPTAAGHVAREDESDAISLGSAFGYLKDAFNVAKDGYDAFKDGKSAYESFKGNNSRRQLRIHYGWETPQSPDQDQTGVSPDQGQTGVSSDQDQTGVTPDQYQTGVVPDQYQTGITPDQYQRFVSRGQYQAGGFHHDHHYHHHGQKYRHGHRQHGMHRRPTHAHSAHSAQPMAHTARELEETGGIWGNAHIAPQWRFGYTGPIQELTDVRPREAESRAFDWSKFKNDVSYGGILGIHPMQVRDLADVLARETGSETDSEALSLGSVWDALKDVYTVGKDGYDLIKDVGGSSGNTQSSSSTTNGGITAPTSSTKRELLEILARETGSEALSLGFVWDAIKDVYKVGKDGYDVVKDVTGSSGNTQSSSSKSNDGITAPTSSTKRELLDILARQTGSEAISLGPIVDVAKDAYTVGKDGYDAYEAVKDAYNNFKSSRSLLDELD